MKECILVCSALIAQWTAACAMDSLVDEADTGIGLCLMEYSKVTGDVVLEGVDRAYAYDYGSVFIVRFAKGELGTFGPRSQDYEAKLVCFVDRTTQSIVYSAVPGSYPIIGEEEIVRELHLANADSRLPTTEFLFLRAGDKFVFSKSQDFSDKFDSEIGP